MENAEAETRMLELIKVVEELITEKIASANENVSFFATVAKEFGIPLSQCEQHLQNIPCETDILNLETQIRKIISAKNKRCMANTIVQLDGIIEENNALIKKLESDLLNYKDECYKADKETEVADYARDVLCKKLENLEVHSENKEAVENVIPVLESIVSKNQQINEMKTKIEEVKNDLKKYMNLPPNVLQAEMALKSLKNNYNKTVEMIQHEMRNISNYSNSNYS